MLTGGHLPSTMEEEFVLCLSPNVPNSKSAEQDQAGQGQRGPSSTYLAKTSLVPLSVSALCLTTKLAPYHSSSSVSGWESCASPQPGSSAPQCEIHAWFSGIDVSCSTKVQQVFLNNRKTSTHITQLQKWKRFIQRYSFHYLQLESVLLFFRLDYLPDLKTSRVFSQI